MKSNHATVRPCSNSETRRSIGIGALLCLAIGTLSPSGVAAADREMLYSKAEDLIRYTDDVKGLRALIAQGADGYLGSESTLR
jgi:hypothetical protein